MESRSTDPSSRPGHAVERPNDAGQRKDAPSASAPLPSISLPSGGGAIRGIGEKFTVNPVTGTGSLSVPLVTSPGRSGFGPQLSLSYDSGAGNGILGFGWHLSLPAITRKTDKGLPQYHDDQGSDVFILSGTEDLVPVLGPDGGRLKDTTTALGYTIHRYRPRIEGLFARIERWTSDGGDIHWRSISKDNILTVYGKDKESRIADPVDSQRIFSWLICEARDDKGNAILYNYKGEDATKVDLMHANECNRGNRDDPRRMTGRHLKRIRYGNRVPFLDSTGQRPRFLTPEQIEYRGWMFEVVFDYGEHDADAPKPNDRGDWLCRHDPFSSYRAGFEVRTYRLCQRVLMFHHFAEEKEVGQDCLVRSTDFVYRDIRNNPEDLKKGHPIASFVASVTQCAYKRTKAGEYLQKSLPPLELEYSQAVLQEDVREVDADSLENLPIGLDNLTYQWVDLDGEGVSGILTEQGGAWFYKRNLSPLRRKSAAHFGPVEIIPTQPAAGMIGGHTQLLDLKGTGQVDLVQMNGPTCGFYERTDGDGWAPFRAFRSWPNIDTRDPNLKFVDLTGDGRADILITEDAALTWYASLAQDGFGPAVRQSLLLDEERGPRLLFADSTESVYLSDMSGDGLADIVRIRNGEVCYWPNCGYGCFGAKVAMDSAPWFDHPDQFDQRRIRLADIDGSGTCDIVYLGAKRADIYYNQAGNSWAAGQPIAAEFSCMDSVSSVQLLDLLGNGTACLAWSSPLPGNVQQPMRYIDLMSGQKPHLLVKAVNNLGMETRLRYAPSTQFYQQDKAAGRPWVTKLPFVVHVVDRVESFDVVGRNRFVTQYKYHHGYFDGAEREFRGFGMVEQLDTESFATFKDGDASTLPNASNVDETSHVPPMLTRKWFHPGAFVGQDRISRHFEHEYYREGGGTGSPDGLSDVQLQAMLLDDTILPIAVRQVDGTLTPHTLTAEEAREACRSLKGALLRQEVYALDGTQAAGRPYSVTEHNYTIDVLQLREGNMYGVFVTHPREQVELHYERKLVEANGQKRADPRVGHSMALEVDAFGNVLRSLSVGYRRRALPGVDAFEQQQTHLTLTVSRFANRAGETDWYRVGLPVESRKYEVVKPPEPGITDTRIDLFGFEAMAELTGTVFPLNQNEPDAAMLWPYHHWDWRRNPANAPRDPRLRLIEHVRTLYLKDDLSRSLPLGQIDSLALPFENYKLAFTQELGAKLFVDSGKLTAASLNDVLLNQGRYIHSEGDANWWIPSGRLFYSPNATDTAEQELAYGRQHFFLALRYRDPFHTDAVSSETFVRYDDYDLLIVETRDALGNRVTVGERDVSGTVDPSKPGNDYRLLQPRLITDPNRNRTEISFDTLGLVAGTAVKGKDDTIGDNLDGFEADATQATVNEFYDTSDPHLPAPSLLKGATTRVLYDLDRFRRTRQAHPQDSAQWLPVYAATLARETHANDPAPQRGLQIQISISYSDGFGREIQKKAQAEPGPLVEGGPVVSPRWVATGWTIFNNKGKPVRQYEPYFSQVPGGGHQFEYGTRVGVSPILFYDTAERVVAILHPNHTYNKLVLEPWQQTTYDENDTVAANHTETGDPRTDADIMGYVAEYFKVQPSSWQTWYQQRITGAKGAQEADAAKKAAQHANTPTISYLDSLGRTFLTAVQNRIKYSDTPAATSAVEELYHTRVDFDIEGNQREVIDAKDRIVLRHGYDMLGEIVYEASMDAGERWALNDVTGKPIRSWDSRGHIFRTEYDPLRRPSRLYATGTDAAGPNDEVLIERLVYGEQHPQAELHNLRGKLYLHLDPASVMTIESCDFKGNLLHTTRQLAREYKQTINWSAVNASLPAEGTAGLVDPVVLKAALESELEAEVFDSRTAYDALNRPVQLIAPRSNQPGAKRNVIQPTYNEANLLEKIHVWLDYPSEPAKLLDTTAVPPSLVGVNNIEYDARRQRLQIEYKNGASTRYRYDPETFRMTQLYTRRGAAFTEDCGGDPPPPRTAAPDTPPQNTPCGLQNLSFTYDPTGNITYIRDDAQQTLYFRNKRVVPSAEYTYDAAYRLIEATGREHLGQVNGQPNSPTPPNALDSFHTGLGHPNDGNAMGMYMEQYVYDFVGNFQSMRHRGTDPAHPGWNRSYQYNETSLIEDGTLGTTLQKNNRLSSTTIHSNNPVTEPYAYDTHGNIVKMPHLGIPADLQAGNMHYDHKDQLRQVDKGGGGTVYYTYDAAGLRTRKVWEKAPGLVEERIYLGGFFELFRRRNGNGAITLERETLHIMDDRKRVALVETRTLDTAGNDTAPELLIRYQFSNHLGSSCLELDDQAQIISYEECTPYGSTSYQAVRSKLETPKRYRFTGKERDEESGLNYHGARYYMPWLGRWASCDPAPLLTSRSNQNNRQKSKSASVMWGDPADEKKSKDDKTELMKLLLQNLYQYGYCNPVKFTDNSGQVPTVAELQQQLIRAGGDLLTKLSVESVQHGMHRQTIEAALGELQGAELVAPDARTYNHVQNFRNAVNALSKPLTEINRILIQLRNSGPEGARVAAQGAQTIRPAMDLARNVVQAGEAFEEVARELESTNNLTRLQGAPLETGRNMVRQLLSMRLDILPRAIMDSPVGQRAFALFNQLPATLQAAQSRVQEITAMVTASLSAYASAAQAAGRSVLSRAGAAVVEGAEAAGAAIVAMGSTLVSFLIIVVPPNILHFNEPPEA